MGTIGNTYDKQSFSVGHARKVWRTIRHVYPGGGKVENIADWKDKGVIPSGRPCKFDPKAKTLKVYTAAQVKASAGTGEGATATDLGINGYIQEDVRILNGDTVGTATVVYNGELYEFMFDKDEVEILKANTATPQITWVY